MLQAAGAVGAVAGGLGLSGCTLWRPPSGAAPLGAEPEDPRLRIWTAGWSALPLPGKPPTRYQAEWVDGRAALRAEADRSAALWRRRLTLAPDEVPDRLAFDWRTLRLLDEASVAEREHEDAVARVILGFDGDGARLSARNRLLFELSEALTGEAPPFATLMYVWDTRAAVEDVIISPRTDRIRKIVVESGPEHLGQWRRYSRDVLSDFRRAFGEAPGRLLYLAVMTDTDNTQSNATTWYANLTLSLRGA